MAGFQERYELGDEVCYVIGYCATFNEALAQTLRLAQGSHQECGGITIYDRMAHRGRPEMWNQVGTILRRKEV